MISNFELVALSAQERLEWHAGQDRAGRAVLELNLRDTTRFSVLLTVVTLLVLLATYVMGDSISAMPAWMNRDMITPIELLGWGF